MPTTARRLLTSARTRRTAASPIAATDGELLMRFRRGGDPEALAEILDRHAAMVWGVCRNVLHREADAQDAFQATFLILLRRADSIRASESAAGWLYRVALRAACDARRTRLRRREAPLDDEPLQPEPAFPDIERRQLSAALMDELRALPTKYQAPLVLRYLEGLSRQEIADQLDTTVATVQGRLVRGKRQLRSRLIRRGVSLSVAMGVLAASRPAEAAPVGPVLSSGGAIGAHSAIVQQLTLSGARSMMLAAYAKPLAVAATIAIAAIVAAPNEEESLASNALVGPASNPVVQLDATPVDADEGASVAMTLPVAAPVDVDDSEITPEESPPERVYTDFVVPEPESSTLQRGKRSLQLTWLDKQGRATTTLHPEDDRGAVRNIAPPAALQVGGDVLLDEVNDVHPARLAESLSDFSVAQGGPRIGKAEWVAADSQVEPAGAKQDAAAPQQELVDFYQQLVKRTRTLHDAGAPGGDAASLAMAERAYAEAQAKLQSALGEHGQALTHYQKLVEAAEREFEAVQNAFDAGRVTLDLLVDAAERRARVKQKWWLEAQQPTRSESAGTQSSMATPEQLDLELQHWQMREKALQLRVEAAEAMVEEQQRVRDKVANSISEHTIKDQQASALDYQAGLLEAQAKVLEMKRRLAAPPAAVPAPPSPSDAQAAPLTPAAADLMKQQLDLELNQWRLKARAFEQRAAAMEAEVARAKEIRKTMPKSVAEYEIQKKQSDQVMMQAQALEAQARAVEMQRRLDELQGLTASVPLTPSVLKIKWKAGSGEFYVQRYEYEPGKTFKIELPEPLLTEAQLNADFVRTDFEIALMASATEEQAKAIVSRLAKVFTGLEVESVELSMGPTIQMPPAVGPSSASDQKSYGMDSKFWSLLKKKRYLEAYLADAKLVEGLDEATLRGIQEQAKAIDMHLEQYRAALEADHRAVDRRERLEVRPEMLGIEATPVVPDKPKQGNWRTFYKPSELDPMGWAVIADLRQGSHAPAIAGLPEPRPYLAYYSLFDERPDGSIPPPSVTLNDPGKKGHGNTVRPQPGGRLLVRGQMIDIRILGPGRSPGSQLVLVRSEQGRSEEELAESAPDPKVALRLLYERPKPQRTVAGVTDLTRQRDQLQQQVEELRAQAAALKQQVAATRQPGAMIGSQVIDAYGPAPDLLPVAAPPYGYPLPAAPPANSSGKVQAGDHLVLTVKRAIRDGDNVKDVFESQVCVVDYSGKLSYSPRTVGGGVGGQHVLDVAGKSLAQVKDSLHQLDSGVTEVRRSSSSPETGPARPLISASPGASDQLDAMRKRLEEQGRLIEKLQSQLAAEDTTLFNPAPTGSTQQPNDYIPFATPPEAPSIKIEPGQRLFLEVTSLPNGYLEKYPGLNGQVTVEAEGTISLGAAWGRAEVAGLTLREAEEAIGKLVKDGVASRIEMFADTDDSQQKRPLEAVTPKELFESIKEVRVQLRRASEYEQRGGGAF